VVIVNKAGAGTVAASKYVLDGRSDGHTLYNTSTSSMMVAPLVHKTNFSWRDFIGLGQIISERDALFVRIPIWTNSLSMPGRIQERSSMPTPGPGGVRTLEKIGCFVSYLPPEDYEKTLSTSEGILNKLVKLAGLDKK
jgi:hypothetical protein